LVFFQFAGFLPKMGEMAADSVEYLAIHGQAHGAAIKKIAAA